MAVVPSILSDRYVTFFKQIGALPSFPFVLAYLLMVFVSGIWTRLVSPFSLKGFLVVHNFVCVILSLVATILLWYGVCDSGSFFEMKYNSYCKYGLMVYVISKYVELLDTVFMILRHRQRQISFLHVYHHSTVILLGEYAYQFAPWPPVGAGVGLNAFVHVFLYTYYCQAALTSTQRPSWKKGLTQLQILQFLIDLIEATLGYLYHGFCIYGIFYGLSMLFLFSNFYYQAYVAKKSDKKKEKNKGF